MHKKMQSSCLWKWLHEGHDRCYRIHMAASASVRSPVALVKFHDFTVEDVYGNIYQLDRYAGKILVIINTASFGNESAKVFRQMNELQAKYSDHVAVLGFPCNQFGHCEHGVGRQILDTMRYVQPGNEFNPSFCLFNKVDVNGLNAHPMFKFLRETLPLPSDDLHSFADSPIDISWSPICRNDIASNFEKFIVAPNGKPYRRYSSRIQAVNIQNDIQTLIEKFKDHPSMKCKEPNE